MLACLLFGLAARGGNRESAGIRPVLSIAAQVEKTGAWLVFMLRNDSRQDIVTTPICTNWNRVIVRRPSGEETEEFYWKKGVKPLVIAPSQTFSWELNLAERITFDEPGLYTITWRVGNVDPSESPRFLLLKTENVQAGGNR